MFLMKSRWPGASMTVCGGQRGGGEERRTIMYFGVSNFHSAMSIVIPRSRSAFNLSSTHAYLKEPLPSSAASCARSVGHGRERDAPSRTSRWYACRYHRTCRSGGRWSSTCQSRRGR